MGTTEELSQGWIVRSVTGVDECRGVRPGQDESVENGGDLRYIQKVKRN